MSAVSSVIKLIPEVERAMMIKEVFSYERMKDRILCRLAGKEKCGQLSEDIVRMSYLDVSVIFCVFPEKKDCRKSAGFRISRRDAPILGCDSGRDDERRVPQYEKPVSVFFSGSPGCDRRHFQKYPQDL